VCMCECGAYISLCIYLCVYSKKGNKNESGSVPLSLSLSLSYVGECTKRK